MSEAGAGNGQRRGRVSIASDRLRVSVDLDRGAHIFSLTELTTGIDVLYRDPRGVAGHVIGGWYELMPNAGPASSRPAVPMHGDVRDLPWRLVSRQDTPEGGVLVVETVSEALPLQLTRRMQVAGELLTVQGVVTNLSMEPVPYLWGQHITLGQPFLAGGVRVEAPGAGFVSILPPGSPASRVDPDRDPAPLTRLPRKGGGTVDLSVVPGAPAAEMLIARGPTSGKAAVANDRLRLELAWDTAAYPALWLWLEHRATAEEPFAGQVSALAVEPQSSAVPGLEAAVAADEAPILGPGCSRSGWVTARLRPAPGERPASSPGEPRDQ